MSLMHDWVLSSVEFDWESARAEVVFDTYRAGKVALIAEGVGDLHVPQMRPWGPSVHVNEVRQPRAASGKPRRIEIEMQSGDVITINARSFAFPDPASNGPVLAEAEAK